MRVRSATASLALLLGVGVAGSARAYEDQLGLGLGLGYAYAVSDDAPAHGALADLSLSAGLGQAWTLRGRGGYAFHPADAPLHAVHAAGELLYVVDVVEVVPYGGLGIGGSALARAGRLRVEPVTHAVLGLDWLVDRALAVELDARLAVLPASLDRDPMQVAVVLGFVWLLER